MYLWAVGDSEQEGLKIIFSPKCKQPHKLWPDSQMDSSYVHAQEEWWFECQFTGFLLKRIGYTFGLEAL